MPRGTFTHNDMLKHLSYPTVGTCSRQIDIETDGDVIRSVTFTGGCHGKGTSCPDQLARALRRML